MAVLKLSLLQPGNTSRLITDVFRGYNHNMKILDGEMFDTRNLTADTFPLLSSRKKRGVKLTLTAPGGLIEKDLLYYVDDGSLYKLGDGEPLMTGLAAGEKQLVSMGAYVVIFPDKKYYNTENPEDQGSLESDWSFTGEVSYAPCNVDGEIYENLEATTEEPENPENGDYWLEQEGSGFKLHQYSSSTGTWVVVQNVYTRVSFPTQGELSEEFSTGDGVEIAGLAFEELNGNKYIYAMGADAHEEYLVLVGLVGEESTSEGTVTVGRKTPAMDFVVECQNRLWGCYYGTVDGEPINEVYCSALGDFKNWRQYQGLSTDSWAASVGSDGAWTGAINYLGHPTFFKENRIHLVTVSASGGHRLDETVCRGVQKGSHKSLAVVGETLYYKTRTDVCAWQGGFPTAVSEPLGEQKFSQAVGGAIGAKYFLSMLGEDGAWNLFVYDTSRGLWMREDELQVRWFAAVKDELWAVDGENRLLAMLGTDGTAEDFDWAMETGLLYYEQPDHKYLSRYDIRLRMEAGGTAKIWMQYDSDGEWIDSGTVKRSGTGTVVVPIRPRRCDHLRMRLTGTGDVKIYSIARTLEVGSDV